MWVYRGILPHFEVFTRRAEDHLLQDEAPDEGVEGEVGEPHDPREDAGDKEAWNCHGDANVDGVTIMDQILCHKIEESWDHSS